MPKRQHAANGKDKTAEPPEVKVVAEMPHDAEIREQLEEMKENDGYPPTCH